MAIAIKNYFFEQEGLEETKVGNRLHRFVPFVCFCGLNEFDVSWLWPGFQAGGF